MSPAPDEPLEPDEPPGPSETRALISREWSTIGLGLVVVATLMMVPIGYLGKNQAPGWVFLGIPIAWVGVAMLIRHGGCVLVVGGGFLGAAGAAVAAAGIGNLFAGRFILHEVLGPLATVAAIVVAAVAQARLSKRKGSKPTKRD